MSPTKEIDIPHALAIALSLKPSHSRALSRIIETAAVCMASQLHYLNLLCRPFLTSCQARRSGERSSELEGKMNIYATEQLLIQIMAIR